MNCGLPVKYEGDSGISRALNLGSFSSSLSPSKSISGAAIAAAREDDEKNLSDGCWRRCRGKH
jgi:hypothetical protein